MQSSYQNLQIAVLLIWGVIGFSGCTGTPMPIPPSVNPEQISLESLSEDCTDFDLECVRVNGQSGAIEAGVLFAAHSLNSNEFIVEPVVVIADGSGAFSFDAHWHSDASFRNIVHGRDVSTAFNLRPDVSGSEPWPVDLVEDTASGTCITFDAQQVDFGTIQPGEVATALVTMRNICEQPVLAPGAYGLSFPELVYNDVFSAMVRLTELNQNETATFVVAFWAEAVGEHFGAIIIEYSLVFEDEYFQWSIPVRGRISGS